MNSHICQVINTLGMGGAEQYVVQLSNYLNATGLRVSIVAGEPQHLRERLDQGIAVETLSLHPGPMRSPVLYAQIFLSAAMRLVAYFRKEKVTLVHTHLAASALPAWVAAKLCGIPVVHSKMHTDAVVSKFERCLFSSRIPLWLVARFLVFTRFTLEEAEKNWHAPPRRIWLSSIGVNTTDFHAKHDVADAARSKFALSKSQFVMLVVARLYPEKDVELAIRAALLLDAPEMVLLIAGDGPQRLLLEEVACATASRTCIRFLGRLPDPKPAYAAADILLQTTRGPDLGTVVLESMASGTPVLIAYRNEDERRMAVNTLGGVDIGAIASATPEAMAEALRTIFSNSKQLCEMSSKARTYVEQHHAHNKVYPALTDNYFVLDNSG